MDGVSVSGRGGERTATYVLDVAERPVDHGILEGAHVGWCDVLTEAVLLAGWHSWARGQYLLT